MCGIFALMNNETTFPLNIVNEAFEKGKNRGPEHSVLEHCDNKLYFGFHRLAINGLNSESNQPIKIDNIKLICNGEIYNCKRLYEMIDVEPQTNSDCEIIIHLYKLYGIEHTMKLLDGVFSFILYDYGDNKLTPYVYVARDPYGVRPLYVLETSILPNTVPSLNNKINVTHEKIIAFSSELKVLNVLLNYKNMLSLGVLSNNNNILSQNQVYSQSIIPFTIRQFKPGHIAKYSCEFSSHSYWKPVDIIKSYNNMLCRPSMLNIYNNVEVEEVQNKICYYLNQAVKKRVIGTCERPIACLLSGGLDSSLITALVNKYYRGKLETYSIGMAGSEDLIRAKQVADYLKTNHTEIILSKEEFFNSIPETIRAIESYDTTTVRASVGNYLIGKYISKHSNAKVIFNGDGSDELTGGYLYFLKAPNDIEFDKECRRLLNNIHFFDVLRSDKSISSNGLEPRTPFLDREFVEYYLSIPISIRNPMSPSSYIINPKVCEKYMLRQAFSSREPTLLPDDIIWRTKEAFSDGVSGNDGSWFEIIDKEIAKQQMEDNDYTNNHKIWFNKFNKPLTREQQYYRDIYDKEYPNTAYVVPYFWMPKYVNASDSSARTLEIYKNSNSNIKENKKEIIATVIE